ncbi:MAG: hypothetical protein GX879_00590, partial [Bacteroidales bacterium]|nr:hypothetical protein [Bacteroidales bacterium]
MKKIIVILALAIFGIPVLLNAQESYNISVGGTQNTCNALFYDSGGPNGSYGTYENYTITFCAALPDAQLVVHFSMFDTETNYDKLTIYDGPNASGTMLVNQASGTSLANQSFTSTGSCLTFVFVSDVSVVKPGWAATVKCSFPCQDFTVDLTSINPAITNQDSLWVDICLGEEVLFTASGDYPNSGANYDQSNANTTFYWTIASDNIETESGVGLTSFSHVFTEPGGYHLFLVAEDMMGCAAAATAEYRVRVSIPPDFTGTTSSLDTICPHEPVDLLGVVTPIPWEQEFQNEVAETTFLPDGSGVHYHTSISNSTFPANATVTSVNDILSICVNMEHTYMGD